jgi:hypothetical protein
MPLGELLWSNVALGELNGADMSSMLDDEDLEFFASQGISLEELAGS